MKIAIFTDVFPPLVNGVVTHIINTSQLLCRKNRLIIFAPKPKKIAPVKPLSGLKNLKIYYLPSFPAFIYPELRLSLPFSFKAAQVIKGFQPDIIHFHSPGPLGIIGITLAKKWQTPLVATFHGYIMEPEYLTIIGLDKFNLHQNKLINRFCWTIFSFIFNQADTIISPSKYVKKDLLNHHFSTPIKVISNGVYLSPQKTIKLPFNLPNKYFIYTGRLSKEKSLNVLIRAFALFAKKTKNVDLVIVGDGPLETSLKNLARSLSVIKRTHFLGPLDYQTLTGSDIYKKGIGFITASKSETQSISILEALSFGLPIIGPKTKAMPELIQGNGILCSPDNIQEFAQAMFKIANNPNLQKKFHQKSLKIAQKHSILNSVKKLESLYQTLIRKTNALTSQGVENNNQEQY